MTSRPKCIIVTGRPGSGKTTLARALSATLWLPLIGRDALKEGYVNTLGQPHAQLPQEANSVVTDFFFTIVNQYLANQISIVIEAAFQHKLWAAHLPEIAALSRPYLIVCTVDPATAARRHLQRGLAEPRREYYHGDDRVQRYRAIGAIEPPDPYIPPQFELPTLLVETDGAYVPPLEEIVEHIRAGSAPTENSA